MGKSEYIIVEEGRGATTKLKSQKNAALAGALLERLSVFELEYVVALPWQNEKVKIELITGRMNIIK